MSTLEDLAREICENVWGFRPVRQIKPVHLANGLFRSISGQEGSPSTIRLAAGGFREGNSPLTSEAFMGQFSEVFHIQSRSSARDKVNDLRSALDLVLSQDRSMYAKGPFTLTLSHRLHTSSDPSDEGSGAFLACLLAADSGGNTVQILRSCLQSEKDNVYTLTAPLLADRPQGPIPLVREETITRIGESAVLQSVQKAFRVLVKQEVFLEKTEFLQRVVTLGSFGLYTYLANRGNANGGHLPLLLCAQSPSDSVREASRSTFTRFRQKIQREFARGFERELNRGGQDEYSSAQYRELFRSWLSELGQDTPKGKKHKKIWEGFLQDFDSYLLGAGTPATAFVHATVPAMFLALTEEPPQVATTIGRLCGLVYPRLQGRGEKYLLPSPSFLDMLVTALVEPDEEIPSHEFWDRAWDEFGLSCGSKGSLDARRLADVGIRQASPVQLEDNARAMVLQLTAMGHAKQLPDDVAMIRGIARQRG